MTINSKWPSKGPGREFFFKNPTLSSRAGPLNYLMLNPGIDPTPPQDVLPCGSLVVQSGCKVSMHTGSDQVHFEVGEKEHIKRFDVSTTTNAMFVLP